MRAYLIELINERVEARLLLSMERTANLWE